MKVELTLTQGGRIIGSYQLNEPGEYTLGRDPSCSIPVEDAEMSHQHARLRLTDSELLLEDLGSSNGTFVDAQRIRQAIAVRLGQKIQLGATVLEMKRVEEHASSGADVTMMPREAVARAVPTPRRVQHVQQHELGEEVAHGGMGAVLRAKDMGIDRTVALKVALDGLNDSPELIERFKQEAKITGQLEHPGIVPVHELGTDEQGRAFYTMKFVQGVNLHDVLEKIKAGDTDTINSYPLAHLLTIFQKVCDAVAFAHSKGIVHRDLKPANIMIGEYGEVLVMDWGLAKIITRYPLSVTGDTEARESATSNELRITNNALQTLAGAVMGTPQFMAPEQAEGKVEEIDARSDIFSLGAILYNILTLHPPVTGDTVQEILQKIRAGEIAHPSAYNPKSSKSGGSKAKVGGATMPQPPLFPLRHCPGGRVPESLSAVTMKALAVRKEDRYQIVQELQKDIEAYQGGFATSAEHASAFKLIWLLIKRHKTLFLVSHTALLFIVIVSVAFSVRNAATLRRLRATAPEFYAQAQSLIGKHEFEEALMKVSFAISLRPAHGEYHTLKGNILESLFRIREARDAYAEAFRLNKDDPVAGENLQLCQKLLAANAGKNELLALGVYELQKAMLTQRRFAEAAAMVEHVKGDKELVQATAKAVLQQIGLKAEEINASRLKMDENGMLELDLSNTSIGDLTPLKGLPLVRLDISETKVADLTPLKGMALRVLALRKTRVKDLSPLRGMNLIRLNCNDTQVGDLTPLKGMPLQGLGVGNSEVTDISPLRGMKLQELSIDQTEVSDIRALTEMTTLGKLDMSNSKVADLAALKNLAVANLLFDFTPVTDLSPLRAKELVYLSLYGCEHLHDLRPLAECATLEYLILPPNCEDIEFLRRLPKLRRISHRSHASFGGWDQMPTAAEFWKEYDEKKRKEGGG